MSASLPYSAVIETFIKWIVLLFFLFFALLKWPSPSLVGASSPVHEHCRSISGETLMRYFKASSSHQYFTGFFFTPLVVKNRWKGICDVTCINVALPSLICLLFLSVTSIPSICLCFSLHVQSSLPFSNLACSAITAYHGALAGSVHWQTPGKFCTRV